MSKGVTDQYVERLNKKCIELFNTDIKSYLKEQNLKKRIIEEISRDFCIGTQSLREVYKKIGIVSYKRNVTKKQLAHRDVFRKFLAIAHGNPEYAHGKR